MKKPDLSKLSKPQIKEMIDDLAMRIIKSHVKGKENPSNRSRLRREIARLIAELNSRKEKK